MPATGRLLLTLLLVLPPALEAQVTLVNTGTGGPANVTIVGGGLGFDTTEFVIGPGSLARAGGSASASYLPTGWAVNPAADGSLGGGRAGFTMQWWYKPVSGLAGTFFYVGGDPQWSLAGGQPFRIFTGAQAGTTLQATGPFTPLSTSPAVFTASLNPQGWVHLALVYDHQQGLLTWFVNGVQDTQVSTTVGGVGTNLQFCGYTGSSQPGPAGNFDDLRFYDFARPSADIAADFLVTATGSGPSGESNIPTRGYYEGHLIPLVPQYQLNSQRLSVTVDGALATSQAPAIVTRTLSTCWIPTPQGLILTMASNDMTGTFDLALSTGALAPVSNGGTAFPGGPILNLSLLAPLTWLNGAVLPNPLPMTGMTFPGAASVSVTTTVQPSASIHASIQGLILSPAAPTGFDLSQATRIDATVTGAPAVLPGPTTNAGTTVVNVTQAPGCWTTSGVPFFGTVYTELHVSANGRVLFGGPENGLTPTVFGAMTGLPFAGFWTDLDPSIGTGSITITSPALDVVRVQWNAVPYASLALAGVSFAVELDAVTGNVVLDGLSGITPNPGFTNAGDNQFLGVSPGGPNGLDPGPVIFQPGLSGVAAASTHMAYDWYVFTTFGGIVTSLDGTGLNRIVFSPSLTAAPGYDWAGF